MSGQKKQLPPRRIQNVFIFLLLAIFAISAIFLTALSAQVYRDTVEVSGRNNAARIAAAVVRGAVYGEDSGNASVRDEGGVPVLTFTENYDGEIYLRRLYCAAGSLRESLMSADAEFDPESGEELMDMASFTPVLSGRMLTCRAVLPDGAEQEVSVCLRAGGEAE